MELRVKDVTTATTYRIPLMEQAEGIMAALIAKGIQHRLKRR